MSNFELKLGDKTYSRLNVSKTEEQLLHNTNAVYVATNNKDMSDLLQLQYFPENNQILLGSVKQQFQDENDNGEVSFKQIYLNAVGYGENTGGGSSSGSTGGSTIVGNYVESISAVNGIVISGTSRKPIISVSGSSSPSNPSTNVSSLDTPDYYALLELLNVMEVQYEDEPLDSSTLDIATTNTGDIVNSSGFRLEWTYTVDTVVCNCIRWKNFNTGGQRYDGDIYLKIIEYEPGSILGDVVNDYGANGDVITNVSSNGVNQKLKNTKDEWYEWYFPKNLVITSGKTYVFIPHHDKKADVVTDSTAKFIIFATSDINTGAMRTGLWTGTRSSDVNQRKTPIIQFCTKTPTTIVMKK